MGMDIQQDHRRNARLRPSPIQIDVEYDDQVAEPN
jgi:hypothetical protein